MPLWKAIFFFGIPAAFTNLVFWKGMPLLDFFGPRLFFNFLIGFGLNATFLIVLALYSYRSEGNNWSWRNFSERFRIRSFNWKLWLRIVPLTLFLYGSTLALAGSSQWMKEHVRSSPKFWARITEPDPDYFMEVSLQNRFGLLTGFLFLQIFYVVASELWWRGYILPRQELQHGQRAWIIHGIFWSFYEGFMIWQILMIVPGALAISYVAQREQNTWTGIIARIVTGFPSFLYLTYRLLLP